MPVRNASTRDALADRSQYCAGAGPIGREWQQADRPRQVAVESTPCRLGQHIQPRRGDRTIDDRAERLRVGLAGGAGGIATIERDGTVAGRENRGAGHLSEVRPDHAWRSGTGTMGPEQCPPGATTVRVASSSEAMAPGGEPSRGGGGSVRTGRSGRSSAASCVHRIHCGACAGLWDPVVSQPGMVRPRTTGRSIRRSTAPVHAAAAGPIDRTRATSSSGESWESSETRNASLHPHLTPSSGGPNSVSDSGTPAVATASNAFRSSWGTNSQGLPADPSKGRAAGRNSTGERRRANRLPPK